jgi:acetyl esterase/lipase
MMISDISRAAQARGLGVDYRLAPEHPFPAAIDDCESAYDGLLQQGIDPRRLVLTGDSAGGALVLSTLVRLKERGAPLPAACVLMSPWVDLACSGESVESNASYDYLGLEFMRAYASHYLDGESLENSAASPIHASLEGLPPMLVQAGGAEMLLSDIKAFCARAEEAGVDVTLQVWDGMVHAFQGFTFVLPEARDAMAAIGDFIQEKTRVYRRSSRLASDSRRSAVSSLPPHLD